MVSSADIIYSNLDEVIASISLKVVAIAFLVLLIVALISLAVKRPTHKLKLWLFLIIASTTIASSFFLAASTIYINTVSSSGGPVHWHADYEVWHCGREIELEK